MWSHTTKERWYLRRKLKHPFTACRTEALTNPTPQSFGVGLLPIMPIFSEISIEK